MQKMTVTALNEGMRKIINEEFMDNSGEDCC